MSWRRGFRTGATALGTLIVIGGTVAATGFTWTGGATRVANDSGPRAGVPHQVSEAAQDKALSYWTAQRMLAAATASGTKAAGTAAPKGIPTATKFTGSPPTGALFYTTGGKAHYCSASVVDSTVGDLVLTAAHCVYNTNFATNVEYVPEFHDGKQPYGAWPVVTIYVASGWQHSPHNPNLDFAFLSVTPASKGPDIQKVTGGLTIEFTQWYSQKIEVVGHNDTDAKPVRCATKSFRFRTGQMEFYCHGFWTGTSGGPWIIGYNAKTGGGKVFGVIGGYEEGGDYEWASYSSYFGPAARSLFQQAEHQTLPPPPTPSASPSATSASAASATTPSAPSASATTPSAPPASATSPSAASASATSPPPPSAPATPSPSPSPSATPTVVST